MKIEVIVERGYFSVNVNPDVKNSAHKLSSERTIRLSQIILKGIESFYEEKPQEAKGNPEIHVIHISNIQEAEKKYWVGKCNTCGYLNIGDPIKLKGQEPKYCSQCGVETGYSLEKVDVQGGVGR